MLKNKIFTKTISLTVMGSLALFSSPKKLDAAMLVPVSFSQMYYLAQNGEVEALRGSVRRGMNIDVMNQNGDTGLCIAAKRRDSRTYNAFRAAGANPRHPCTQSISGYEDFVNSANTAPINTTSREAYGMMGKESYQIAPWVWWTAGAVAVGAGIALAAGGGGGGGSSGSATSDIDSAGKYLAVNGLTVYTASKDQNRENSSNISNSNSKTEVIDELNFNQNATENSKPLNVILKAVDGGTYVNSEDSVLTANSGVIAMSAYKNNSLIVNNGQIRVNGNNAGIGMLAGQAALARNNGSDANGIYLSYSGTESYHTAIGMYADAGAKNTNNGTIKGTASSATQGSLIGMENMIINANVGSKYTTITSTNTENGVIELIAGTGEDSQVNLIGMGTYLDDDFLNGNKVITNAEKSQLYNRGDIILTYLRKYIPEADYFTLGTGGIVGMKADARSTATNEKNITVKIAALASSTITSDYATIAGMQSVHGGVITNATGGNIVIEANISSETSNQSAYGMVAVKGGGAVAENLGLLPTLTNNGDITLKINNGFGMATYNGGTLTNTKNIILGAEDSTYYENNVGMYDSGNGSKSATLTNSGEILIYSSSSVGMKTDYQGNTTLTNNGVITIKKSATGSHPFAGKYSKIVNNGTINYETTPTDLEGTTGTFPDDFSFDLKDAVINTNGENTLEAGENNFTVNVTNKGTIQLSGSSYTAAIVNHNALGTIINETDREIIINDREGEEAGTALKNIGIYVSSSVANGSSVVNKGLIEVNTKYSAGMASDAEAESVLLTNTGTGNIKTTKNYSIGMYASNSSSIHNYGTITLEGKDSYGIVVKGQGLLGYKQEIENNLIILKGDNSTGVYIADDSTAVINDAGTIRVLANNITGFRYGNDVTVTDFPTFEIGDDYKSSFTYFNIAKGKLELKISDDITSEGQYFAVADNSGYIVNNTNISTGIANATLLKGISSGLTSTNNSALTLKHDSTIAMYVADGHIIINSGTININEVATNSNGMYADDGGTANNSKTINIDSATSKGMYAAANGTITNNGTIIVNKGYGMYALTGGSETNNGYLTINGEQAYGMYALADVVATNENTISVIGKKAYGMYAISNGTVENNATINITGERAYGMYADVGAEAYNKSLINVKGQTAFGMYVDEDATVYNEDTITITGQYASGIYLDKSGTAYNNGSINVNGDTSCGMSAGAGNIYNNDTITINQANSYGMYSHLYGTSTNSSSVIIKAIKSYGMYSGLYGNSVNEGTITISEDTSYGMYSGEEYATITNKSTIDVDSNESYGMYATYDTTATNTGDGEINVAGKKSYGMYAEGFSSMTNKATIDVSGANSYGMYADEYASISNDDTITADGTSSYGMYTVENGTITNNNTITVGGSKAYGMYSETEGTAVNNSSIIVTGSNAYGMYNVSANSADNEDTITVEGSYAYGMYAATNGTVTNKSTVTASGDNSYGMYAEGNGTAINGSSIVVSGNNATGMYADTKTTTDGTLTGTITNNGSVTVSGAAAKGMAAAQSVTIENGGTILVNGDAAYGMYLTSGGEATNVAGHTITIDGSGAYGMYSETNGTLTNNSSLMVNGDNAYGMYLASGGTATNASSASITVKGSSAAGMYASRGTATNNTTITVDGSAASGMYATSTNGTAENKNKIDVYSSGAYGMYAESGGTVNNISGSEINVSGAAAYGMYAASGGTAVNNASLKVKGTGAYGMSAEGGIATNNSSITVSGNNSYGMYAASSGTAYNNSSISVTASSAYGMYATSGGTAVNKSGGSISVSGSNSYGMYAASGGTVINNGTINISGSGSYGIYNSGGTYSNTGNIDAPDGYEIYPPEEAASASLMSFSPSSSLMLASTSGKIINNGKIITDTAIDFNESTDDTGTISVGNGGTYEALSFSGNVVADYNIVTSGFDDIYTNTNSFVGEDNGLNITSGSYLFDAQKSLNDEGNIDVIMNKKDFSSVVENSSLAEFLEQNYADENNESLYAALKSSGNAKQFNNSLDDLFGKELLSDLTFEDLNVLHELNFDMNNNMFAQKKGSFALTNTTELVKDTQKSASNGKYALSGYNDGKTSVAVGLAVSDIRAMKKGGNQSAKLNKNILLSIPMARKAKGFEFITSPKFGYASGSYEREGLNGETYDGTIEKRMFALMNEARYPLNFGDLKVIPSAEFNMIGYNIKGREDKKQYSLNIDSQNHYSVESGLGLNLEKVFSLSKDSNLKLNGGVAVYKEFADPYELKVGMAEMNGNYRLRSEKYGDKRTVLRFGAGYTLKEDLEFTAGLRTNIAHDYHTDAGINLNYHF